MTGLDGLIPEPGLVELDYADVAVSPGRAWDVARKVDLARSPLVRSLFAIRTLPSRLAGREAETAHLRIDDITSSEAPGFRVLAEAEREVVVGAIGKVWQLDIPFVEVGAAEDFLAFSEPGNIKVAWALRALPRGDRNARIEVEVRVAATDEASWKRFRRYFRVVGPGSHFIRRHLLASLVRELGSPEADENERPLPGDDLLPDASAQMTHGVTLKARPEAIWPWLVQMGCRRAGWYSYDILDNAGVESAKAVHPELQEIAVGDVLPATPDGDDGFEVLRVEPPQTLLLGGLYDPEGTGQRPFAAERPERYWHVTWAFVLEPLAEETTRLFVRVRAAFPPSGRFHVAWIRPVHHFMQARQLENLKARVEDDLPRDGFRDVASGLAGAAGMALHLLTPFLRSSRSHWGLEPEVAARAYPGDELVPEPRWSWTHGIEIEVPTERVWPWVAQIGADRGGFYSYQWLENLAGCDVRNAETTKPEWQHRKGDLLSLHPAMPPIPVVAVEPERFFLAHAPAGDRSRPWVTVSWLFFLEPLGPEMCRLISRFRTDCSDDLATRLAYGPTLTESIGFVMDRQMLRGVKARAERTVP